MSIIYSEFNGWFSVYITIGRYKLIRSGFWDWYLNREDYPWRMTKQFQWICMWVIAICLCKMQKLPRQDGLFLFSMPILNLILCEMRNVNWEWEDSVPLLIFYFIFQAQDQGCAVGLIIATITYYRLLCKSGESQALGIKINCCGTSFLSLLPHMINWVLTFAFLEIIVESGWVELDTKLLPFVSLFLYCTYKCFNEFILAYRYLRFWYSYGLKN